MSLAIENVTVRFGGVTPLDDVSFTFEPGVCGIIGPNGAGKTTLFNVLSGFALPVAGSVTMAGEALLAIAPHRRATWGLRRTFQQEQVIRTLSVWDNARLGADHTGASTTEVQAALDYVGLTGLDRPGSRLTILERRLVEVARCVIGAPRLVLLDEPAAGLDPAESAQLLELITGIPGRFGALVLLVDHDMDLVRAACGTVAVLDFGKRIAFGPTAEVLGSAAVRRAYLGVEE